MLSWGGVSSSYCLCMYYFPSIYFLSLISKSCYHLNRPLTITCTLLRTPELELHHQIQINVISKTHLSFLGSSGSYPIKGDYACSYPHRPDVQLNIFAFPSISGWLISLTRRYARKYIDLYWVSSSCICGWLVSFVDFYGTSALTGLSNADANLLFN